ncbi:hypothetical protein [Aquibacillus albus]|uniref:Uncharacterized protein n=1 Tax=Aquibacillus albus TaxID=1168171 RepID=A0ABS2MXZ1_9BACI|nr:hypothetical protein [Aquibacillus albus]MBM7570757.1 hypothetical protein [Aquibacillus albus]
MKLPSFSMTDHPNDAHTTIKKELGCMELSPALDDTTKMEYG